MKKLMSLLLAVAMILTLVVPVSAVDGETEPSAYQTVLTLVKDGKGLLTGNDFTEKAVYGDPGFVISATKNVNDTETFLKAFAVPGARMVLKYRISGEQINVWFNWLQTNTGFCIPSWHGEKNVIFKNEDGTAHGSTVSEGDHVVYVDCAEYINMYKAETNLDFYNNFSSFGFQSGATGFYFEEMTLEIPSEINLDNVDIPGRASGTVTFYSTATESYHAATVLSTTGGITNGTWNRLLNITDLVTKAAGTDLSKVTDINVTVEALDSDSFPSRIGDYWDCVEVRAMVSGTSDPVKLIGSRANKEAITGNVVTMKQYLANGTEGIFIHLQDYAAIDEATPVTFKITVAASASESGPQPLILKKYPEEKTHAEFARYTPYLVPDGYGNVLVDDTTNMTIADFNAAINKEGAKLYIDAEYSGWSGNYWFEFTGLENDGTYNLVVGSGTIRDDYGNVLTAADLLDLLKANSTVGVPEDYQITLKNIKRHAGDATIKRFEVVVPDAEEPYIAIRSIFNDKIALEYAVKLPVEITNPVMQFTVNGETSQVDGTIYCDGNEAATYAEPTEITWYFTFEGVTPAQIGETISAKIIGSDVVIPDTSVLGYCTERLANSNDATFKQLVSELVRYASSANKLNGGEGFTADNMSDVSTVTPYENRFNKTGENSDWDSANLLLNNTITMCLYWKGDVAPEVANISAGNHTVVINEAKKRVEISGFTPLDYGETITATLGDSTVTYSVGTYIARMSVNGTDFTKELCTNIQNYGRAAEAYASATNQN